MNYFFRRIKGESDKSVAARFYKALFMMEIVRIRSIQDEQEYIDPTPFLAPQQDDQEDN